MLTITPPRNTSSAPPFITLADLEPPAPLWKRLESAEIDDIQSGAQTPRAALQNGWGESRTHSLWSFTPALFQMSFPTAIRGSRIEDRRSRSSILNLLSSSWSPRRDLNSHTTFTRVSLFVELRGLFQELPAGFEPASASLEDSRLILSATAAMTCRRRELNSYFRFAGPASCR